MTYKIFHGPGVVHFFEKNSTVVSGQPNQEEFEDEADAVSRVLELDENFYPQWDREETYGAGDRVAFLGSIYRALEESDSRAFGTFNFTPGNSPTLWARIYRPDFEPLEINEKPRRRAHNPDGTFKANDPNTTENEAWE